MAAQAADGKLILYIGDKNVSSWSVRGFLALVEKGLEFEERVIELRKDKDRRRRREVSPTGKVPVLHHELSGVRCRVIPDSLAIIEYLEETFAPPAWPGLWPADPDRRAHARWLAATMHSGFQRLRESMSFNRCFLPKREPATPEALEEAREVLSLWEDALSRKDRASGSFLVGEFSAADILFAPVVVRLSAYGAPAGTAAAAYMRAVLERPSMRRWMDAARALSPVPDE